MIELLYTTLVLFGFFFPLFLIFPIFKFMKLVILSFQLILSFILLSKNFYKKHSLYNSPKFQNIQSTDFYPIKDLYKIRNEISFNITTYNKFSLIKTEIYSKQCLKNYFIQEKEFCPITDIILEKTKSDIYKNYIQLNDNEYIYYTNENKLGKLYKSFNYSNFKENKEDVFSLDKIVRKEYNKLSNPILNFKNYIKYSDIICTLLIFSSLLYSLFEPLNNLRCGFFILVNLIIQITLLVLYILKFVKFIEIKKFLFDNNDIYGDDSYYPNKVFNIDSFPIAISLNFFIYDLLFIFFPNKISCFEVDKNIFCEKDTHSTFYIYDKMCLFS